MSDVPWVFLSKDEWARAQERAGNLEWAKKLVDGLPAKAEEALEVPLPAFEWAWWDEAKAAGVGSKERMSLSPRFHDQSFHGIRAIRRAAGALANAYLFHSDARFAQRVREILLHCAKTFRLDVAVWDTGMEYGNLALWNLKACQFCWDVFSEDDHRFLREWFLGLHKTIYENDLLWIEKVPGGPFNNHLTHHKWTMTAIELFLGLDVSYDHMLDSPMGIRDQMEKAILDHGLWIEHSLRYQTSTIRDFIALAELLRRAGAEVDLYSMEFANGASIKSLLDGIISVCWPDLTIPTVGDSYGRRASVLREALWKPAYAAYGKPEYAWLAERCESETMYDLLWGVELGETRGPSVRSFATREHSYAFLTTVEGPEYWDSDATVVLMTLDPWSTHGHLDSLSLQVFSHGEVIADDAEGRVTKYGVCAPILREVNFHTVSHNTVMVDGKSEPRRSEALRLVQNRRLGDVQTLVAADLEGLRYEGVREVRSVALTPEYVLDVFELDSARERRYDWLFHPAPDASEFAVDRDLQPAELGGMPGESWFSCARSATADDRWEAQWRINGTFARLTMIGEPGTEVLLCDLPGGDKAEFPTRPMLVARRLCKETIFVALYQAAHE
ncbi:MAG: heparinase II/III family protein, partial [Planctomycetia bacterium]|nr:heparinase II/III family protein [Planctomycetia bacterium]